MTSFAFVSHSWPLIGWVVISDSFWVKYWAINLGKKSNYLIHTVIKVKHLVCPKFITIQAKRMWASRGNYLGNSLFPLFVKEVVPQRIKSSRDRKQLTRSELGNSNCPPALLLSNRDDSLLGSTQMLTWLTKSYAKFNLSGPLLPLLGKTKQVILFVHLNSIVQYW